MRQFCYLRLLQACRIRNVTDHSRTFAHFQLDLMSKAHCYTVRKRNWLKLCDKLDREYKMTILLGIVCRVGNSNSINNYTMIYQEACNWHLFGTGITTLLEWFEWGKTYSFMNEHQQPSAFHGLRWWTRKCLLFVFEWTPVCPPPPPPRLSNLQYANWIFLAIVVEVPVPVPEALCQKSLVLVKLCTCAKILSFSATLQYQYRDTDSAECNPIIPSSNSMRSSQGVTDIMPHGPQQ